MSVLLAVIQRVQSDTRPPVTAGGQACGITLNDGVISDEEVSEELHR